MRLSLQLHHVTCCHPGFKAAHRDTLHCCRLHCSIICGYCRTLYCTILIIVIDNSYIIPYGLSVVAFIIGGGGGLIIKWNYVVYKFKFRWFIWYLLKFYFLSNKMHNTFFLNLVPVLSLHWSHFGWERNHYPRGHGESVISLHLWITGVGLVS